MAESKQQFMASQELNPQAMAGHRAGVGGVLQFPKDIGVGDEFLNHMSFESMKVSGGVDTRSLKFQATGGTVVLPIPSGATTASYQQGWEQTGVGFSRAAAASTPVIQAALKGAVQTGLKGGNVIDNMKDAFDTLTSTYNDVKDLSLSLLDEAFIPEKPIQTADTLAAQ